jgi:glycosyltransferase involved in cell wall biosynthesis
MSRYPLVSVITIFLNAEKFIQESIESVFAQTYDNWELLLVDDGSTDGSTVIARRHAEKYPEKVRYLEHDGHQNHGMSATRNLGIRKAKGDYIAILDSDDVWLPHKLEEQVTILDSHPEAGMVYGRTKFWFSWTGNSEDVERDFITDIGVQPNTLVKPPTMLAYFLKTCPYPCSVLVRRDVVENVGGFEEAFRGMYEDQVFFAKVFAKAPVFVSGECWDRYRRHPDSCMSVAIRAGQFHPVKPNPTSLTFLKWLEAYLLEQGIKDAKVWSALREMLLPYDHPILCRLVSPIRWMRDLLNLTARHILPAYVRHWLRDTIARQKAGEEERRNAS